MKAMYSWIIYSCLIFGTGILCDRKIKSREAVSSYSVDTDDTFKCSNGLLIEWSWVCDGDNDCLDGSDETKDLCAIYEFGTNMTMDCGRINIKNQVISEEGNESLDKLAPWTVGIYRNISELELSFFGSIIAPNIVISEARRFVMNGLKYGQISLNDGEYKIGGLPLTQKMIEPVKNLINVKMVYLRNFGSTYADISVLVLAKKVPFGNGFAPVCIDWNRKYYVWDEDPLKIIGLEKRPNVRKVIIKAKQLIPYNAINQKICMKKFYSHKYSYLTVDKFCIRLTERDVEYRLPGAGISFLHSNTNFLTGIIPYQIFNLHGKIINDTLFGITKIRNHVPWIRGIFNKYVTVKKCILPTVEGVIYSYEGSNEILSPGTLINRHLKVIENCEVGYHKAYYIGFRFCLGKGKWIASPDKLCFKMCPPLLSDGLSLNIKCSYNGKYANCSNPSIPDTIATPSCMPTYAPENGVKETLLELYCQSNGTWNNKLYRCVPHCGIPNKRGEFYSDRYKRFVRQDFPMLSGEPINGNVAPWNAGVYRVNVTTSEFDLICGGSIISPNLVVSAAHCFWEKGISSNIITVNEGLYKIAVGKYSRDIKIIDNIQYTKIMDVKIIFVKERYYGVSGYYAGDIAVVLLQNKVSYGTHVVPICIDWNGNYNVVNGTRGMIVGWGRTETGMVSDTLLLASLPYIDHSSCREMYTNGFESYVTADKFCAGSVSGQGVSVGDSGAGLCYLHSNSYYLTGVTSVKDPETNSSFATFTDIQHHIQWIRKLYDEHN